MYKTVFCPRCHEPMTVYEEECFGCKVIKKVCTNCNNSTTFSPTSKNNLDDTEIQDMIVTN